MIEFGSLPLSSVLNDYTSVRAKVIGKVKSARFYIKDETGSEIPVSFHKPPELNYPVDGYVEAAFNPIVTFSKYHGPVRATLVFNIEYETPDGNVKNDTIFQQVEFNTQSIIQWYISELRTAIGDDITVYKYIPQRFYIRPKDASLWTDEELKRFLDLTLVEINSISPPTLRFSYSDTMFISNFLIYGAMVKALTAAGLWEVYNFYETNAPIRVTLYKGDKLDNAAKWVRTMYFDPLKEWKKNFAYYTSRPKSMVLTRMPFRVIRPLNMLYGYYNFFGG